MKLLALILAVSASALCGCSTVHVDPDYLSPAWQATPQPSAPAQERLNFYESHRIQSFDGPYALVNGEYYEPKGMGLYYRQSGAEDALDEYRQARSDTIKSDLLPGITIGVGAVLGFLAGSAYQSSHAEAYNGYNEDTGTYDNSYSTDAYDGLLIGAGCGLVAGILEHWIFSDDAKQERTAAAESFNRTLLQNLKFQVAPSTNGPRAALATDF
jgi:hypothetical protein